MIKPYLDNINQKIKSRTKEEWVQYTHNQFKTLRSYIQENGELSFIAAFVLGIFVVVFFRLAFAIFFLTALFAGMVWALADSEIERRQSPKNDSVSGKVVINNDDDVNPTIQ